MVIKACFEMKYIFKNEKTFIRDLGHGLVHEKRVT